MKRSEALRRLGAPVCASCGNICARQRLVTVQRTLPTVKKSSQVGWLQVLVSDYFMPLCSGSCTLKVINQKIYIVDAKLSLEPDPNQKPFGVVTRVVGFEPPSS